jgi:hypothetical protein
MLKTVIIAKDSTDPASWIEAQVENIHEYIKSEIEWSPTTVLYHGSVDSLHEVTPFDDGGIDRLDEMPGPFYVVQYPEWAAVPYVIAAIALILSYVAYSNIPKVSTSDQNTPSPNNALTDRQNSARPFKRIPDIYGTLRSTPDLLMRPYSVYVKNIEYEHSYMCIGRGYFDVHDCRDDTTPISDIEGAGVTVFPPNESPNSIFYGPGVVQDFTVFGEYNSEPVLNVYKSTSVNGQDLLTDSATESIGSSATMVLSMPPVQTSGFIDFTGGEDLSNISVGGQIYLFVKSYKTHHTTKDTYLSGTYTVKSKTTNRLELANVQSVANDWGWLRDWPTEFHVVDCHIVDSLLLQVGPFLLPYTDQTEVWLNLVASSGLYKLDGDGNSTAVDIQLKATIIPTDALGAATGDPYDVLLTVAGDARKNTVARTWKIELAAPGPCNVTVRRTSDSPISSQVVDGLKWKDLLSITPVLAQNFGDITTAYSVTKATEGALAVKERKLNMLVTRRLPVRNPDNTFGPTLAATNVAADIICAMALDPKIGGRSLSELDVDQIYSTMDEINGYFGSTVHSEFCATFDDDNTSYEEMVSAVTSAIFCTAYRQGHQMRLHFERQTEDASILFGHRNILPGTQQRTVSFGNQNDYDFVQYNYVSPVDDSQVTLYVPNQGNRPQQITSIGVRNYPQAYAQAWRAWQRIQHTNTTVQFTATQEASMLLLQDRILVADNTRSGSMDGHIEAQNVLELQLSQPAKFEDGKTYTIFLQGVEGSVENIGVVRGATDYNVMLSRAPAVTLSTSDDAAVKTLYWIVPNDDVRTQAFLVSSREPDDGFTEKVTATNYDDRYYLKDLDYRNGTIPADPN